MSPKLAPKLEFDQNRRLGNLTEMDLVAFISTESGLDLIVSFAVCCREDPVEIESLTVMRTPKYESILDEWERGASVSFEREVDDERGLLRAVAYLPQDHLVTLRTDKSSYELDVRKVDPKEMASMRRVFRLMNFDSRIELTGM